ncbi:MAG: AraC family transcriptional regulator [Candidatus Melainabacteria bacterium]|nr:MAG: AraC family transcriptional regulator [Candidatus Melainabacteria bacterium]
MIAGEGNRSNKTTTQVLIFDGFEELDALGIYEPLAAAGFDVKLVSLRKQDVVTAAYGLKVIPHDLVRIDNKPSLLCIPGGGWLSRAPQGAWAEAERGDILSTIREFHAAGVTLAAICTGALLLARAGLLKDRHATTNHRAIEELKALGARVIKARVVDDGDIVTAGGITSSLDLSLWLVERFCGAEQSIKLSSNLEFERRGTVWTKQS